MTTRKDKPAKKTAGRPSSYTDAIADKICARLAEGESMVQICREPGMPNKMTVDRWAHSMPEFAAKRARARELQADNLLEKMAEIEGETLSGVVDSSAARCVLSSMQWRASKLAPKNYGDRVALTGLDGGPIKTASTTADLTDAQLDEELAKYGIKR